MARGGRGSGQQVNRRPIELTGSVSLGEKNDLVTLVNAITEKMHNDLSSIFDSPPLIPIEEHVDHHHWLHLSLFHRKDKSAVRHSSTDGRGSDHHTFENAHQIVEQEENEALTPQLSELKKEAILNYRKWQTNVITRMKDLFVHEPMAYQGGSRGRGRGGRGAPRARGSRGSALVPRSNLSVGTGPPRIPTNPIDRAISHRFAPIPSHLWLIPPERRRLMLHITMLLLLSLQEYSSYSRQLLLYLTSSLNLPLKALQDEELRLAEPLAQTALDVPEVEESQDIKVNEGKNARRFKGGYGSASGHAPSLAPALVAATVGSTPNGISIAASAAAAALGFMADNGQVMGSLFGMSLSRPASKALELFAREIQDFALLPLHMDLASGYTEARQIQARDRRMRLVIALNGWMTEGENAAKPWECLGDQAESFVMQWEIHTLLNLGSSLETVIKSAAWSRAHAEIQARTSKGCGKMTGAHYADNAAVFSSLIDSSWPMPLLKISKIIDNPWSVGMVRAEKAGSVLADAIMRGKFQGDRPVSLVGYSLAARAIYTCLMILAERRQFGLIDSVVLMGAPAPSESRVWLTLKSVVCGRLVNVFSESDYILGFLYRTSNIHFGVAGLQDIQGAEGVENYRVRLARGHLSYRQLAGQVLKEVGWEDVDHTKVNKPERGVVVELVK